MSDIADAISSITKSVTKEWTQQCKAEERGSRSRSSRRYIYSGRINHSEVAHSIIPDAYQHASGGGKYSVSKRQLYYACREEFKALTGRELRYEYFASTLLVKYLNTNEKTTAAWKITADPRGALTIPNAAHAVRIPCGTLDINAHLNARRFEIDPYEIDEFTEEWPSLSAGVRYQAVLYIEKEGFEPLMKEAKIAERFDLAILSCKGQSVVAARKFVDEVCHADGVPLLVVHDFDKAGFEISQSLTTVSDWAIFNDRVTYSFRNEINVTDLGLRLEDVEKFGLDSEDCEFKGHFADNSICTAAEQEFLKSNRRVELNAFTSPQFIEWLESKLSAALPTRLVPDHTTLSDAYRRAILLARIQQEIDDIRDEAEEKARNAAVPKSLAKQIREKLTKSPSLAWDTALLSIAKARIAADEEEEN